MAQRHCVFRCQSSVEPYIFMKLHADSGSKPEKMWIVSSLQHVFAS